MSLERLDDIKEQIRQSIDIVDLVGSYLELRRQGRLYVAHCPWHDDTRPSLQVNPERQSWKCWVCGNKGGDLFSFVMEREGIGFREALEMLADRAGVTIPRTTGPAAKADAQDKRTLYEAMSWVVDQTHSCLLQSSEAQVARDYLHQRQITSETMRRFRVGFWPNKWQWLLDRARTTRFTPAVLEAIDAVAKSSATDAFYDRFKGRVIFPICDTQRRPLALGGRILPAFADEKAAKYINSRETRLFSKGDQLYGLDVARDTVAKRREAVVVEGYTDVLLAHQYGFDHVVAVLGTALGAGHIRLLRRFADRIILLLDGDDAGQRRTNDILSLFVAAQVDLRVNTLPDGLDPADFLVQQGGEAFSQLLDASADALQYKLQWATRGVDLASDTHRASQALEDVLATIAQAPRLIAASETSRLREQQMLARLARQFAIPEEEIRGRLADLRRRGRSAGRRDQPVDEQPKLEPMERELFEILIAHADLVPFALEAVGPNELASEAGRAIFEAYVELESSGSLLDFSYLLTRLEETRLKNILVELDELARQKAAHTQQDGRERLNDVIRDFRRREKEIERRPQIAALQQRLLNEQEELAILEDIIDQERDRQGISAPTDG